VYVNCKCQVQMLSAYRPGSYLQVQALPDPLASAMRVPQVPLCGDSWRPSQSQLEAHQRLYLNISLFKHWLRPVPVSDALQLCFNPEKTFNSDTTCPLPPLLCADHNTASVVSHSSDPGSPSLERMPCGRGSGGTGSRDGKQHKSQTRRIR